MPRPRCRIPWLPTAPPLQDGLYAWAQVRRPGALPFSALVGGLIVILVGVFVTQQGFMQQGGRKKGRSTDRVD